MALKPLVSLFFCVNKDNMRSTSSVVRQRSDWVLYTKFSAAQMKNIHTCSHANAHKFFLFNFLIFFILVHIAALQAWHAVAFSSCSTVKRILYGWLENGSSCFYCFIVVVTAWVNRKYHKPHCHCEVDLLSQQTPCLRPGLPDVFWRSMLFGDFCQLLRLQTRLDSQLSLPFSILHHFLRSIHPSHFLSVCFFQASNGNDPWSVWNADPSGGSNNNWASNPEGTQTGKSAGDPWASVSQGHPQAYQGPGKDRFTITSHCWLHVRNSCSKLHNRKYCNRLIKISKVAKNVAQKNL